MPCPGVSSPFSVSAGSLVAARAAAALGFSRLAAVSAAELYDHARSDVAIYSRLNFEKQVSKNRDKGISIVHFYDST